MTSNILKSLSNVTQTECTVILFYDREQFWNKNITHKALNRINTCIPEKKIFIILDPFNFLKGIERWPDNKVMDISDLTTEQQRIHKYEKEENQP